MGLGLALAMVLFAPASWFIPFASGETYRASVLPMQVIAAAIPLRYGAHVYGTALSAAGLQSLRARVLLAVIVMTVVVESALILSVGLIGSAIGIVFASGSLLAAYFVAARRVWGSLLDATPVVVVGAMSAAVIVLAIQWPR